MLIDFDFWFIHIHQYMIMEPELIAAAVFAACFKLLQGFGYYLISQRIYKRLNTGIDEWSIKHVHRFVAVQQVKQLFRHKKERHQAKNPTVCEEGLCALTHRLG